MTTLKAPGSSQYRGGRRPSMVWKETPDFRVCILGYPSVGKTAISTMLTKGHFSENYAPTVEGNYQKSLSLGKREYTIQILDTMGQEVS